MGIQRYGLRLNQTNGNFHRKGSSWTLRLGCNFWKRWRKMKFWKSLFHHPRLGCQEGKTHTAALSWFDFLIQELGRKWQIAGFRKRSYIGERRMIISNSWIVNVSLPQNGIDALTKGTFTIALFASLVGLHFNHLHHICPWCTRHQLSLLKFFSYHIISLFSIMAEN